MFFIEIQHIVIKDPSPRSPVCFYTFTFLSSSFSIRPHLDFHTTHWRVSLTAPDALRFKPTWLLVTPPASRAVSKKNKKRACFRTEVQLGPCQNGEVPRQTGGSKTDEAQRQLEQRQGRERDRRRSMLPGHSGSLSVWHA